MLLNKSILLTHLNVLPAKKRMFLISILVAILWNTNQIFGVDLNSIIPRTNCYLNKQEGCNEEFIDVYKNLSRSATNLTDADTWFLLFTRKNPDEPEKLHKCGGRLPPATNFSPDNRLIVILIPFIAGYCDIAVYREWTEQYLKREDVNVLVVDWSWGNHADYATAILNSKITANQTIIVLKNIKQRTGISKDKIYLIGHSTGAQIAAFIAYEFPVNRITGIDPAGPGFAESTPLKNRLDPSDADLVDVWHTNMGECLPFFGIGYDAGHIDFYINGGKVQPPCYEYALTSILKQDYIYGLGTLVPTICFHAQCAPYYKVSINPGNCQFVAVKCKSYDKFKAGKCHGCGKRGQKCTIMGYDTDKYYNSTGKKFPQRYYVDTSLHCPWCDNSKISLQGFAKTYRASLQSRQEHGKNQSFT